MNIVVTSASSSYETCHSWHMASRKQCSSIYIFELYLECSNDPALQTLNIYSYILNQPTPTFWDCRGSSWRFVCISFHCCRDSTAFVRRMSGMELKEPKAQSKQNNPRVHRVRCSVCFSVAYSCCHMLQVNHLYTFKNGVGSNPVFSILLSCPLPWNTQYSNFCDQLQGLALCSDLSNVQRYTADRAGVRKFTAKLSP